MQLKNKVALITGGTKGIGLGIAVAMLDEGMNVAITGSSTESVERALTELSAYPSSSIVSFVADVRNLEKQQEVVDHVIEKWGKLDVVIANAGIGHFANITELTPEQWHETIDVNLTGVFNTVKATLQALTTSKGYIITIASLAGTNFFANGSAYNASKFGLVGFTQAVMLDVRKQGIKVSTIMPGSVSTYFNGNVPSDVDSWKIQPEDIGKLVIDLLTMNPRTLPSKIEVRPSIPPKK